MDDEQGPWWTRPPEPDPQARAGQLYEDEPYASEPSEPELYQAEPYQTNPYQVEPPEPEPPPAPAPPPRPLVRRVAVPQPPEPRTEAIPTGPAGRRRSPPDEIFAVFTGQQPTIGAKPADLALDPYQPYVADDDPPAGRRPRWLPAWLRPPGGRVTLLVGAGGLVVVLIIITSLITGNRDGSTPAGTTPTAKTAAKAPVGTLTGKKPTGLTQLTGTQADDLLRKAGLRPNGEQIIEAWDWSDRNGRNLVVTTTRRDSHGRQTLRVIQVDHLESKPRTLREMTDPSLPDCKGSVAGAAGFTQHSLLVRDLNGDGIAEVTAGWWSRCGAAGAKSTAKLALITNGKKYILRGVGVIGRAKSGSTDPDPSSSHWPHLYLTRLTSLYHQLYF